MFPLFPRFVHWSLTQQKESSLSSETKQLKISGSYYTYNMISPVTWLKFRFHHTHVGWNYIKSFLFNLTLNHYEVWKQFCLILFVWKMEKLHLKWPHMSSQGSRCKQNLLNPLLCRYKNQKQISSWDEKMFVEMSSAWVANYFLRDEIVLVTFS